MLKRLILFLVFSLFIAGMSIRAQVLTAKEIVTKSDEKARGKTSQGESTMTIIRPTLEPVDYHEELGEGT